VHCAGDTLEIGAQWAIAMKDIESFERYMAQLKCYYLDYRYIFDLCQTRPKVYAFHIINKQLVR